MIIRHLASRLILFDQLLDYNQNNTELHGGISSLAESEPRSCEYGLPVNTASARQVGLQWRGRCFTCTHRWTSSTAGYKPGTYSKHFHLDNSPSLFTWRRAFPPLHHHHLPIYSKKQSTINVYRINRGRTVRVRTLRCGSTRVRSMGQCQFSNCCSNIRGKCPRWGNCPGEMSSVNIPQLCLRDKFIN